MDPVLTPLLISGAVSAVSGIINGIANMSAQDRAAAAQDKALQEWLKINIPDPEQQKLALEKFVQQGELVPELEGAIQANPSEFKKITTSAFDKVAQNRALSELENIGYSGGLRLQDKAALQDATMEGQVRDRANRMAISEEMNRKGMGGSGFEVASQLMGQQGGADRDAQNSLRIAAQAQDRALQSIMGAGDLATKYRNQEYGEKSAAATAADRINMFNTQNLQDVQQRNINAQNAARASNLAQKQKTADMNTSNANYQQEYNNKLGQQYFENQAKKAAGAQGIYNNQGNLAIQQGQTTGNMFSNLGNAASGAGTAISNKNYWDDYFEKQKQAQNAAKKGF